MTKQQHGRFGGRFGDRKTDAQNDDPQDDVATKTIKDAHGLDAEVSADHGTGPEYHKDKHPNGRFTGRKDAHGIEIWETPAAKKEEKTEDDEKSEE
jgi:hypothetical protein